jgi:hypothetical protein
VERENVTDKQVAGLLGENVLRAWGEAEDVAKELQSKGVLPSEATWEERIWETVNDDTPRVLAGK